MTPHPLRARALLYAPLALHVVPTLVIGFGFVLPGSPIAGVNQYTLGFVAAVLGFIPSYIAGMRLARGEGITMRRPKSIAEQARNAQGFLGRIVAFVMARETWGDNYRAIEALDINREDQVLDIGCGPGRSIGELVRRAPQGRVAAIDPSALMAELAVGRNTAVVKSGQVRVLIASVNQLPFPDRSFDKALCVHVLYFWRGLDPAFLEIARVLKPGAKLALLFRDDTDAKATAAFPADVYTFPSLNVVINALDRAGLDATVGDGASPRLVLATRRAL